MGAKLTESSYGKSRVRLMKVKRSAGAHGVHELVDLSVDVALRGDFEATYFTGDNTGLVATDTMRNTVYALAKDHDLGSIEAFAVHMARYFVREKARVTQATVTIAQNAWGRMRTGDGPHNHSFIRGSEERQLVSVAATAHTTTIECGLEGLVVLKTTNSGFSGFERDKYTTLKETDDRMFGTSITAWWRYEPDPDDFTLARAGVRGSIINGFAGHKSLSVQQTLHAIGEQVLAECPEVQRLKMTMPNKHCLLVDLAPFGLVNANEVFVPIDEPHGVIEGTVERG